MALLSRPLFYYGHIVTADNNLINFIESGGELTATLNVGNYSLSGYVLEIQRAMRAAGALDYNVSVDRITRLITIAAASNFTLLAATGTNTDTGAWELMGFTAVDLSAASTYTGTLPSGLEYRPQFPLMDYVPTSNFQQAVDATVNKSGSGKVEVVRYGTEKFMECEIDYATDINCGSGSLIEAASTGVADLRAFMEYLTVKGLAEFLPDRDAVGFETFILEKTEQNAQGIGFKLKEKLSDGLAGFYSSGRLTFRKIEE